MFYKILFLFMFTTGGILTANNSQTVVLETTYGDIHIKLFPETAPKACENFTKLAKKGFYNETIFHRVIKDFMIQGGDSSKGGESIWGKPFEDEVTTDVQFDKKGLLAMANCGPNTNGSQFFITTALTPWLNLHHTIFGEVTKGYEVVEKISSVKTDFKDQPLKDQKVIKAYVLGD